MRIGIDLGGTKIEALKLDARGRDVFRERLASPKGDYRATLVAICRLVEKAGKGSVGIGIPGSLSPTTGLVRNANSTWLNGKPLQQDLEQRLGRKVRIANDANCFALSEAVDGAGKGAAVVFGVILGTGVGAGIAVRRKIIHGANSIGGEWGHNPLPMPTGTDLPLPRCWCGRAGCIETYLSGPGLARDYRQATGERSGAEQAVLHEETMARYVERLARSLAGVINVLDPDVVVLGGGMSNVERLYTEVPRLWGRHIFSDHVATRLARNVHGDSSGVRGAAWLWE